MNTSTILLILAVHWVADFVMQTDRMAKGKSKDFLVLLEHTVTYTALWVLPISVMLGASNLGGIAAFLGITLAAHTVTDFFTSRLNSRLWQSGQVHWFFVAVGFDQLLHYTQLFITYQLLKS